MQKNPRDIEWKSPGAGILLSACKRAVVQDRLKKDSGRGLVCLSFSPPQAYEAGVRELERIIRTLFLRIQRKEILTGGQPYVRVTRGKKKEYLKDPIPPRQIGSEDAVAEMLALGVDVERGLRIDHSHTGHVDRRRDRFHRTSADI